jgi:hypothetical protein
MGELDQRSGIGFMRLATVQSNAENQQQRSPRENWDQHSRLHVTPIDCRMREVRGTQQSAWTERTGFLPDLALP